ncbi:MAG TPA: vWA domain-containing protein [Polyangiaceae bacterium]|nr:vWA domain-containing protein [Polyangiaceae bacterium]
MLTALAAPSCGGASESLVSPCQSELTCGSPCSAGAPCGSGQYCGSESICTADCVPNDTRCGSGKSCSRSGKCVEGLGPLIMGGSTGDPGGGGTGGVCADVNINLDKQIPTVLLLVDQSSSMSAPFGTSDRWQVLRTSLMDQAAGVVNTLQAQVRFGLALYSGEAGRPCPIITPVAPAMNNYPPIDAAFPVPAAGQPTESVLINNTPTGESIDAALAILQGVQELGQKVIVLATDGDPDSCADPTSNGTNPPREMSIEAAQRAFQAGVFTFVISVAADADQAHLAELANVGQGYPRNDPMMRSYLANDQAQLAAAFATIVEGVRSCAFAINGTVKSGGEVDGKVVLNGMPLVLNDPNGWRLSSPSTIELQGTACEMVKNADTVSLNATFPCGTIVPPK